MKTFEARGRSLAFNPEVVTFDSGWIPDFNKLLLPDFILYFFEHKEIRKEEAIYSLTQGAY